MSFIAILGAGAIGGAIAHRLASRDRTREIRLIDLEERVAQGKALDILQSSAIAGFGTRITSAGRLEAVAGAGAIVVADPAAGEDEYAGETGLAMLRRVTTIETEAPIVFAGAGQRTLMKRAVTELHVERRRVIGSAPGALESAVRALAALELNGSGTGVQLLVLGVPPHDAVIAWEEAVAFGQPLREVVPAHRLLALSAQLPALWPPGPQALASSAARVAEATLNGSRRRFTAFVSLDQPPGRGAVVAMPLEIGPRGIVRVLEPVLSRQEQTSLENARAG
jgi:malate dehydrogenase